MKTLGRRGVATLLVLTVVGPGCAARSQLARGNHADPKPGDRILARRCTGCHARPDPQSMTAANWLDALDAMHDHVHLPAADWDTLAAMAAEGLGGSGAPACIRAAASPDRSDSLPHP